MSTNFSLSETDSKRLHGYMKEAEECSTRFIGYPIARDFDYTELYPLLRLSTPSKLN
jgi:histidine decarboxylase